MSRPTDDDRRQRPGRRDHDDEDRSGQLIQLRPAPGKTTLVDQGGYQPPANDINVQMSPAGPAASAGPWEADAALMDAFGLGSDAATIDRPAEESLVENRATIDDSASSRGERAPRSSAEPATHRGAATIDRPAEESLVENRATIDDSPVARAERTGASAASDMRTDDPHRAPATIDRPPEDSLVENRATIDEGPAEPGWVVRAHAYHERHPDVVREFNELTGDACADGTRVDPIRVARWQQEHDVPPDGRVGASTLRAARRVRAGATANVQRKAGGEVGTSDDVQATAGAGVRGSGSTLPHLDTIQASFGRHDVSGVRAHVGGDAAAAASAIGAEAYATGNDVAFATAPTLHTAAHEAAHVVQQRGGVQLKGGVGEAGDDYERHADAVADAVVAGRSAEPLLDGFAGQSSSTGAVQRQEAQHVYQPADFVQRPDITIELAEDSPGGKVSISGQIKFSGGNPAYGVGGVKGGQPEMKFQKKRDQIKTQVSTQLAKVKAFDVDLFGGLDVELDAEGGSIETALATHHRDASKSHLLPKGAEVTIAALTLKVTGEITNWLREIGLDPAPYKVDLAARVKVKLDPMDAVHAYRAVGKLRELHFFEKQADDAVAKAHKLKSAEAQARAQLALARRRGNPKHIARALRRVEKIVSRQRQLRTSLEAFLDVVKAVKEQLSEAVGKMTSKAGALWGRFVSTAAGKVVGKVLAALSGVLVLLDIADIASATYHLARGEAKFHLGGGGERGVSGGEKVGATGDDERGTSHLESQSGVEGGDAPGGTESGWGADDPVGDGTWEAEPGEEVDGDEGAGTGGATRDGELDDPTEAPPAPGGIAAERKSEIGPSGDIDGRVIAPGEDPNAVGDLGQAAATVDATNAARGDGAPGAVVLLGENPAAKRIVEALEAKGQDVSADVLDYLEVIVPPDWTDEKTDVLVAKIEARLATRKDAPIGPDVDQELIVLVIEDVARMIEADHQEQKPASGAGGRGRGEGGRGRGSRGSRGSRDNGRRHGPRRAPDYPEIEDGKLTLPTALVEKWVAVKDDTLVNSKAADAWIEANRNRYAATIDGMTYKAVDLEVRGLPSQRSGEYTGHVVLTMMSGGANERQLNFDFHFVPGGDKGERVLADHRISVEPLERAMYLSADGRPTIDREKVIDMGPFTMTVQHVVSMSPVPDDEDRYRIIILSTVETVKDPSVARWRAQVVSEGAKIEAEFALRLLGEERRQ